jgi:type IV pilus assembly protein PilX
MLSSRRPVPRQRGVVLLVALVVLVIMAVSTAAMMRSVSSTSVVGGNLAFQQAAATSADQGVEAAVTWLQANNNKITSTTATTCGATSTVLTCNQASRGYLAARSDPSSSQSWADLWNALVTAGTTPVALTKDAAGNTVSYIIQRMCSSAGDPATGICSVPLTAVECQQSHNASSQAPGCTSQYYYRITVRTVGPRNTVSYTQVMVGL